MDHVLSSTLAGGERRGEWGMGDRACALSYVMSPLQGYDIL